MKDKFNEKYFGKRLKEIRKAKGLTQEAVCEKADIDVSNYSKMETGRNMPSLQSLYKIIENVGFVPNELFEYEHLNNEKSLDDMNMEIYNNFSFNKKKVIYKIFRALEDFK